MFNWFVEREKNELREVDTTMLIHIFKTFPSNHTRTCWNLLEKSLRDI